MDQPSRSFPGARGPHLCHEAFTGALGRLAQGLTDRLLQLLLDGVEDEFLRGVRAPLPDVLQQQGVARQPVQGRHQQLGQVQPAAPLVPLTPLRRQRGRQGSACPRGPGAPHGDA